MSCEESTSSKKCSSLSTYPTASLTCQSSNNGKEWSASASSDIVDFLDDNLYCTIPGTYDDKTPMTRISSGSLSRPPTPLQDCPTSSVTTAEDTSMPRQVQILCDRLTFFQAGPLVFRNKEDQMMPLLPMLDFSYEREILTKVIEDACRENGTDIDVDFQIATRDRIGEVLACEKGQILHFTCHALKE
jgi:hypothetical protein